MNKFFIILICYVCAINSVKTESPLNQLIDKLLSDTNENLRKKSQNIVHLPDIHEVYTKKWNFITFSADFTATNGYLKDLATIKRVNDVEVNQGPDTVTLGINLKLDDLEFGFKNYRAEVWSLGVNGHLKVNVNNNLLYGKATIYYMANGTCHTELNELEMKELDNFKLDISGLGSNLNWLIESLTDYFANQYNENIKNVVTIKIKEIVEGIWDKNDFCEKI